MNLSEPLQPVFNLFQQAFSSERLSHAYLLEGASRGYGLELAMALTHMLFCETGGTPCGACAECCRVREHTHPDVIWIEPESKSRAIRVEQIRALNSMMGKTSYEGGWKVGIILHADCLNDNAANAFLKTLEEPPDKSLLLIVTENTHQLLPTIISRCQRVLLPANSRLITKPWTEPLLDILREGNPKDALSLITGAGMMKGILSAVEATVEQEMAEEEGEDEVDGAVHDARVRARVIEERQEIFRHILYWHRDVMLCVMQAESGELFFSEESDCIKQQASTLTYQQALGHIRQTEEMIRLMERNLPEEIVFTVGRSDLLVQA